jgi:hypothetical protein
MHEIEPLVTEPSPFEVEITTEKLKRYKSSGSDQILAKPIQYGGNTLCSEIHQLINSIWNKKEFLQQWKESIIIPIYKKGDKIDFSNYRGISLLPTTYKLLSNIVSRLTPYIDDIIWDHQCGFQCNRSTANQTLEK